jgi:hypothetical protein
VSFWDEKNTFGKDEALNANPIPGGPTLADSVSEGFTYRESRRE